jgi:hypothetical protein
MELTTTFGKKVGEGVVGKKRHLHILLSVVRITIGRDLGAENG